MENYLQITVELLVGYTALFGYTKIMGKMHFSQLTPFDFISLLVLGELLGNAVYDDKVTIANILFATIFWASLIYASEVFTQKHNRIRKVMEGEPSIIIRII